MKLECLLVLLSVCGWTSTSQVLQDLFLLKDVTPPSLSSLVESITNKISTRLVCDNGTCKCFDNGQLLSILEESGHGNGTNLATNSAVSHLSTAIVQRLLHPRSFCNDEKWGCKTHAECRNSLSDRGLKFSPYDPSRQNNTSNAYAEALDRTEVALRLVNALDTQQNDEKVFDADTILKEFNIGEDTEDANILDKICRGIVLHFILEGKSVTVSSANEPFFRGLFTLYGGSTPGKYPTEKVKELIEMIQEMSRDFLDSHEDYDGHNHADPMRRKSGITNRDHHSHDHESHSHKGHRHSPVPENEVIETHDHDHHSHDHDHHSHDHHQHSHNHDHPSHDNDSLITSRDHDDHDSTSHDHDNDSLIPSHDHDSASHDHHDHDHNDTSTDHPSSYNATHSNSSSLISKNVRLEESHNSRTNRSVTSTSHHGYSIINPDGLDSTTEYDDSVLEIVDRPKRYAVETTPAENFTKAGQCLSAEELLAHFGFLNKEDVTEEELTQLCPAILQQAVSGVCKENTKEVKAKVVSDWELYGYSSLAVLIISLTSLMVVVVVPLLGKKVYQYIMMSMIGLAFGTMAGDALLHLVPQGLGLHSHGGYDSTDHSVIPEYLWRQLGVLGAIYGIFLFESLMEIVSGGHEEGHGHSHDSHGHSHVPDTERVFNGKAAKSLSHQKTASNVELTTWSQSSLSISADPESKPDEEPVFKSPNVCCGLSSMAWVITLGDTIHNLGDGLAIGAAFSASTESGISTSIAVLCHELPHEFGDFIVLLSTGLSFKRALTVNFMSAMSCFVGLYIGIKVGSDETTRLWILVVTAGIFLYVALTEMLPELKQNNGGSNWALMFFVKNLGILTGVACMIVIAIYEDKISFT